MQPTLFVPDDATQPNATSALQNSACGDTEPVTSSSSHIEPASEANTDENKPEESEQQQQGQKVVFAIADQHEVSQTPTKEAECAASALLQLALGAAKVLCDSSESSKDLKALSESSDKRGDVVQGTSRVGEKIPRKAKCVKGDKNNNRSPRTVTRIFPTGNATEEAKISISINGVFATTITTSHSIITNNTMSQVIAPQGQQQQTPSQSPHHQATAAAAAAAALTPQSPQHFYVQAPPGSSAMTISAPPAIAPAPPGVASHPQTSHPSSTTTSIAPVGAAVSTGQPQHHQATAAAMPTIQQHLQQLQQQPTTQQQLQQAAAAAAAAQQQQQLQQQIHPHQLHHTGVAPSTLPQFAHQVQVIQPSYNLPQLYQNAQGQLLMPLPSVQHAGPTQPISPAHGMQPALPSQPIQVIAAGGKATAAFSGQLTAAAAANPHMLAAAQISPAAAAQPGKTAAAAPQPGHVLHPGQGYGQHQLQNSGSQALLIGSLISQQPTSILSGQPGTAAPHKQQHHDHMQKVTQVNTTTFSPGSITWAGLPQGTLIAAAAAQQPQQQQQQLQHQMQASQSIIFRNAPQAAPHDNNVYIQSPVHQTTVMSALPHHGLKPVAATTMGAAPRTALECAQPPSVTGPANIQPKVAAAPGATMRPTLLPAQQPQTIQHSLGQTVSVSGVVPVSAVPQQQQQLVTLQQQQAAVAAQPQLIRPIASVSTQTAVSVSSPTVRQPMRNGKVARKNQRNSAAASAANTAASASMLAGGVQQQQPTITAATGIVAKGVQIQPMPIAQTSTQVKPIVPMTHVPMAAASAGVAAPGAHMGLPHGLPQLVRMPTGVSAAPSGSLKTSSGVVSVSGAPAGVLPASPASSMTMFSVATSAGVPAFVAASSASAAAGLPTIITSISPQQQHQQQQQLLFSSASTSGFPNSSSSTGTTTAYVLPNTSAAGPQPPPTLPAAGALPVYQAPPQQQLTPLQQQQQQQILQQQQLQFQQQQQQQAAAAAAAFAQQQQFAAMQQQQQQTALAAASVPVSTAPATSLHPIAPAVDQPLQSVQPPAAGLASSTQMPIPAPLPEPVSRSQDQVKMEPLEVQRPPSTSIVQVVVPPASVSNTFVPPHTAVTVNGHSSAPLTNGTVTITQNGEVKDTSKKISAAETRHKLITQPQQPSTGPPKAMVKPQVLTHVIEGFVIHESSEPFPVCRSSLLADLTNTANKFTAGDSSTDSSNTSNGLHQQQELASVVEQTVAVNGQSPTHTDSSEGDCCEVCNKLLPSDGRVITKSKGGLVRRLCSQACAKRLSSSCLKRPASSVSANSEPSGKRNKEELAVEADPQQQQPALHHQLQTAAVPQPITSPHQPSGVVNLQQQLSPALQPVTAVPLPVQPVVGITNVSFTEADTLNTAPLEESSSKRDGPGPPTTDMIHWTVQDVAQFILHIPGCEDYAEDFELQEIDGQALLLLKADHLMGAMNMKLGPALKICAHIESIRRNAGSDSKPGALSPNPVA